jgi:hypothetical protein
MSNAQYQRTRIKGDASVLIAQLRQAILLYARAQATSIERAMSDSLVDPRHLCDVWRLDFGALEQDAYAGYLEELEYSKEATND